MSAGGDEYELRNGEYTAVVTQVGAGLRLLRHGDRDLLLPYDTGAVRPKYRGALLAPWPNRVVDGRYRFDGEELQLDLSEPQRRHAIHGLVCWERFEAAQPSPSEVTLTHRLVPREGYPFSVELQVGYRLDDGLACTVTAHNAGRRRAPYGTAPHPYLVGGPGKVDGWTLHAPASEVLEVTPDRLVPIGLRAVEGTPFDFRAPRRVEGIELDHAYTGLAPRGDGLVRVTVTGADGHGTEIAWDPTVLPWVQVHTADLPEPAESRRGLAVEPMTCPPDAFNSGTDLVVLEPGESHEARWTIRAV
ncbi:MAG TPA: aldose 1-epimerase family protein [Nocardioidaceae bacterium]|nr:aldose 1-epimerase family protein [Nocardioidaceae bacterium]